MGESMKKVKSSVWQGSYTVEAAFIMPLVILVIAALIYMAMYMHDKNRIKAVLDKTSIEGSLMIKHETDKESSSIEYQNIDNRGIFFPIMGSCREEEERIESKLKEQLNRGMFLGEIKDIAVEMSHTKIKIKVKINMDISLFRVKEFFQNSGTEIIINSTGYVYYPAEFIRKFNAIEGIADDIKGYDEIIEELQKLLGGG